MAVTTTDLEIRYVGNGTTTDAYAIPFSFLDPAHIYVAVAANENAEPVLLPRCGYTVLRTAEPGLGEIRTTTAYFSPQRVIIFREVPLDQDTIFTAAGPFRAEACEMALDKLLMQVQQINRRVSIVAGEVGNAPATAGGGSGDVPTWLDAVERGTTKPTGAGRLGVERSTGTIWISRSANTGDWVEFRARRTEKLVLALVADAGSPGAQQTATAARLAEWEVDAVLFAGDNNYNGVAVNDYTGVSNYHNDWAAFLPWIETARAFPALGNHDVDYAGWNARHFAKFPYLPGNRRYYKVTLGNGMVDLFVLHSGFDTIRDVVEPDGNAVGSVQHKWFKEELARSRARWRIVMLHHPPVTLDGGEYRVAEEMAWPELSQADLICCGHTHLLEVFKWSDTMLANLSAVARHNGQAEAVLQGAYEATDRVLWANDEHCGLGRLVATEERLELEIYRTDGVLLHSRDVEDFSPQPPVHELYRVIPAGTQIGEPQLLYAGTLPQPTVLRRVMLAVASPGTAAMPWTLHAGAVEVASGTLAAGASSVLVEGLTPLEMIPRGTQLWFSAGANPNATGLDLTIFAERHS